MGIELVLELKKAIEKAKWPTDDNISSIAYNDYEKSLDIASTYAGRWEVLMESLQTLNGSGSRPYAFAGIAVVMIYASYEQGGKSSKAGLEEAAYWLELAQDHAPNQLEINFIEAWIYLAQNRINDARAVLNYLQQLESNNGYYRLSLTESNYWKSKGDIKTSMMWLNKAHKQSQNTIQRIFVLNSIASNHMSASKYEKAISTYKKIMHLNDKDAWAPHNIAWMYSKMGKYQTALLYSNRALEIMNFETGHNLNKFIRRNLAKQEADQPKSSVFKRLFTK